MCIRDRFIGEEGSVQLRGGIVPEAGSVKYCIHGSWNAICGEGWSYNDAFVLCRQLGLPATGMHSQC